MKTSLLVLYDLMDAVIYIVLLEEEILTRRADKDVMSLSLLPGITKSPDAAFRRGRVTFLSYIRRQRRDIEQHYRRICCRSVKN